MNLVHGKTDARCIPVLIKFDRAKGGVHRFGVKGVDNGVIVRGTGLVNGV